MLNIPHIRSKYKDRMLQIAFVVSGWSLQPEGQRHGCVLAMDGKYLVATGFNGPDRNADPKPAKCGCDWCGEVRIAHAEENAILNAQEVGVDLTRCVAYVTKKPCVDCHRRLVGAGIKAIFWLQSCSGDECQWTP